MRKLIKTSKPKSFRRSDHSFVSICLWQKFVDGGLTNNLPILARGRTISVTPFSGSNKDIAPAERSKTDWHVTINQENYLVSRRLVPASLQRWSSAEVGRRLTDSGTNKKVVSDKIYRTFALMCGQTANLLKI